MSLGIDMDGEPILTEEEKRDEFVEIICANCTVDGEDCNALTALECPCVMLALDHYAAWGELGPCGHEFCPPCVACGYPASTKPIYDKAVGTLICTRCGTKQYAKPPVNEPTITKSELLSVVKKHSRGGHQAIRLRELAATLDDDHDYTLTDLLILIPDNYVAIWDVPTPWYSMSDYTNGKITKEEYETGKVYTPGYVMDFCFAFMLVQVERGEISRTCPHCEAAVVLNFSTNTTLCALEGPGRRYGLRLEIKCPQCRKTWDRTATMINNFRPLTKITYPEFITAVADLESTRTIYHSQHHPIRFDDLHAISTLLNTHTTEGTDALNIATIAKITTDSLGFNQYRNRDLGLVLKIALLNRIERKHTCDACGRTTLTTPTLSVHVHDNTTFCYFKCRTCGTEYVWTIWGCVLENTGAK